MDTTIIYHKIKANINCPDGLTAAWIARKVYPEAKIIGWCYEDKDVPTIHSSKLITVSSKITSASSSISIVSLVFSPEMLNLFTNLYIKRRGTPIRAKIIKISLFFSSVGGGR